MVNCVVKGCKNQSARNKKHDGVTFHIFPVRDQVMYHKWITVIRNSRKEPSWLPTNRSVVCSAHFRNDDLYHTVKGLRRVKRDAFPQLQSNIYRRDDGSAITDSQKVCIEVTVFPDSSGLDQPSCSSFADASDTFSDPLPMEEQSEPEPLSMLEIKQEVLWEGEQNCSKEVEPTQGHQGIPASEQTREEDPVSAALEQIREEISALARGDELSAGLEQIRGEIRDLARGDEFDAFGRYVASLLRNMRPRRAQQAQPLIINMLAAEMIKKDEDET